MEQTQSKTEAAALRKFLNKREDIAVQILTAICSADGMGHDPEAVAKWSIQAADALLQKLYIHEDKPAAE